MINKKALKLAHRFDAKLASLNASDSGEKINSLFTSGVENNRITRPKAGEFVERMITNKDLVSIDIDKIQTLEEVKAIIKILITAHSGNPAAKLQIHTNIMNSMPILNNLVEELL